MLPPAEQICTLNVQFFKKRNRAYTLLYDIIKRFESSSLLYYYLQWVTRFLKDNPKYHYFDEIPTTQPKHLFYVQSVPREDYPLQYFLK